MQPVRFVFRLACLPLPLALIACSGGADRGGAEEASTAAPATTAAAAALPTPAAPQGQSWSEQVTRTPEGGYRIGNPDAPIKVVEFASLTCSHCAAFSTAATPELENSFVDSGRVSYEYRNYLRNPIDLAAAQIMECGAPGQVIPLANQLFAQQPALLDKLQSPEFAQIDAMPADTRLLAAAERSGLIDFFAERGIAREQAAACLRDTAKSEALADRNAQWDTKYAIQGTPTILLNGKQLETTDWASLKADLQRLGAR